MLYVAKNGDVKIDVFECFTQNKSSGYSGYFYRPVVSGIINMYDGYHSFRVPYPASYSESFPIDPADIDMFFDLFENSFKETNRLQRVLGED